MAEYQEQYCEKHKQLYGDHLHQCPVCAGEKMIDFSHGEKAKEIFEKLKRN